MNKMTMKPTLVIMTKEVIAGNVKTRLGYSIGIENAAKVHFELFRYLIDQIRTLDIPVVVSLDQNIINGEIQKLIIMYLVANLAVNLELEIVESSDVKYFEFSK